MSIDIRELRKINKKTLAEVANALGVAVSTVSNYEQGIRQINIKQVLMLAELYDERAETIIISQLNSLNGQ